MFKVLPKIKYNNAPKYGIQIKISTQSNASVGVLRSTKITATIIKI